MEDHIAIIVLAVGYAAKAYVSKKKRVVARRGSRKGSRTRHRIRRSIAYLHEGLGDTYFRRAFRMDYVHFKELARKLEPAILEICGKNHAKAPYIHNGPITPDVRLGVAIRYFAGGAPEDLISSFGIGHTDILESVWYVVEAINKYQEFAINYPECHSKQQQIAKDFQEKSSAGFAICGFSGCI